MDKNISILIVDDHPFFRDAIHSVLKYRPYVSEITEAGNGLECLQVLSRKKIDVVLLDVSMPEMDGIDCLRIIRKEHKQVRVIILTQFADAKFSKTLLEIGAVGYLLKSTTQSNFIVDFETIIFEHELVIDPAVETDVEVEVEPGGSEEGIWKSLSSREIEILRLIGQNKTSHEIADNLDISYHTVSNHRKRLAKKLGVDGWNGLIKWIIDHNLA